MEQDNAIQFLLNQGINLIESTKFKTLGTKLMVRGYDGGVILFPGGKESGKSLCLTILTLILKSKFKDIRTSYYRGGEWDGDPNNISIIPQLNRMISESNGFTIVDSISELLDIGLRVGDVPELAQLINRDLETEKSQPLFNIISGAKQYGFSAETEQILLLLNAIARKNRNFMVCSINASRDDYASNLFKETIQGKISFLLESVGRDMSFSFSLTNRDNKNEESIPFIDVDFSSKTIKFLGEDEKGVASLFFGNTINTNKNKTKYSALADAFTNAFTK